MALGRRDTPETQSGLVDRPRAAIEGRILTAISSRLRRPRGAAGFDGVSVLRGGMERWNVLGFKADVSDKRPATTEAPRQDKNQEGEGHE